MIVIGHRGACAYKLENTIDSFLYALELGADGIEFDVQKCKTGEIVVIHDETVDRTTNFKGFVNSLSINDIKRLNIPTLEEVLLKLNKKTLVNIELKTLGIEKKINDTIHKFLDNGWEYENFIISSFYISNLINMHRLNKKIKLGILTHSNNAIKFVRKIHPYSIHIHVNNINPYIVNYAHRHNIKIFVWTINNEEEKKKMEQLHVDGIFSDNILHI